MNHTQSHSNRAFNVGLGLSLALAGMTLAAGVWALQFDMLEDQTPLIGNKVLFPWRQGLDVRVALAAPAPVFGLNTLSPRQKAAWRAAMDKEWGRPNHWLKLPQFDFSLWWPLAISLVLPGIWLFRCRSRKRLGFTLVGAEFT